MKMVHPASGLRIASCETLPISIERDITARKIVGSGLPEKFPDYLFLVLVIAFAEVVVAQATARVGEIVRWPKFIGEAVPLSLNWCRARNRIADAAVVLHGLAHVRGDALEGQLPGRMHADDHKTGAAHVDVALPRPSRRAGRRAAVDTGIGPDVDEHDLAAQGRGFDNGPELIHSVAPARLGRLPSLPSPSAAAGSMLADASNVAPVKAAGIRLAP